MQITVIYDHDHGTDCAGWYVRFRDEDGMEGDCPSDDTDDPNESREVLLGLVEQQAKYEGFALPDGWQDAVEIHR